MYRMPFFQVNDASPMANDFMKHTTNATELLASTVNLVDSGAHSQHPRGIRIMGRTLITGLSMPRGQPLTFAFYEHSDQNTFGCVIMQEHDNVIFNNLCAMC